MDALPIGILGLYLLGVGFSWNFSNLAKELKTDARGFMLWFIAWVALIALYQNEKTNKVVAPFMVLLLLNFFLSNWDKVESQAKKISQIGVSQNE